MKGKKMNMFQTSLVVAAERATIIAKLETRQWFKATPGITQASLIGLPDKYNGYLADLAERPDVLNDGTKQLKIVDLHFAPYGMVTTVFWVETPKGQRYWDQGTAEKPGPCLIPATYEYHSWSQGPDAGSKGVVRILNDQKKPTHIAFVTLTKFATTHNEYGAIGGFKELPNQFAAELREELGFTDDPKVIETHSLGRIIPDSGLSNEHPSLFCADIDGSTAKQIGSTSNPDEWELKDTKPRIVAVSDIHKIVGELSDEAYLIVTIARMVHKGLLPAKCLVGPENK